MPQEHDDAYWEEKLTPEQYRIMRERGTEAPFTGEYVKNQLPHRKQCGMR